MIVKMSSGHGSVQVAGATLAYAIEGAGIPLLVLGSSIYYPRTFSSSLRESCTLVCADLPHFVPLGAEFDFTRISFDLYSECIDAVRADAGIGRVVVAGHSHHGNVALEYARRRPGAVSHLILIGTPPVDVATTIQSAEQYWGTNATAERKSALQRRRQSTAAEREVSGSLSEAYVRQYVTDAPLYWNDPNYDASWLWRGMSFSMEAVHAFRNLYRSYEIDWNATLRSIPVLVTMGVDDFAVPHTLWSAFVPRLENITFRLLERSGHTPQLEEPDAFNRILLSWLTNEGALA